MRKREVQALYLSAGYSDFGDGHDAFSCVGGSGVNRTVDRGLWGESRRGNIAHNKTDTFI